jgi:DNA polymerase-4
VVAAASYEARKFGVRSAMPSATALRLCPELLFVPHRFDVYRAVSRQIRAIFHDYTPLVEPLSLDEAYLDVTENLRGIATATEIAQEIRARIRAETGLTASAGVSYNKFIAKLASDFRKPDGLTVITPAKGPAFVAALPVARFHGVGPVTAAKMERLGIVTGADLAAQSLEFLTQQFGKSGAYYWNAARGVDHRQVVPDRPRKSVGSEQTFARDLMTEEALVDGLIPAVDSVWSHCARHGVAARTVTVKVRYSDFRLITRSRSLGAPVDSRDTLERTGRELIAGLLPLEKGVRLLGISVSNIDRPEAEAPPATGVAQLTLAI